MSDELLILTPEWSDAGEITPATPGSTPGSMGVANLLTTQPSEVCRWSVIAGAGCYLDLGEARAIDTVWLGYHNARRPVPLVTPPSWWKILGGDSLVDLQTGGETYNSDWVQLDEANPDDYGGRTHSFHLLPAAHDARWWAVLFDVDPFHPDGYFEAGRLMIGKAYRPEAGIDYGAQIGYTETRRELQSEGGQVYVRGGAKRRWMRLSWEADDEDSAYDEVLRLSRLRGSSGEMVVCSKANDSTRRMARTVYGVADEPMTVSIPYYDTYSVDLTVREIP